MLDTTQRAIFCHPWCRTIWLHLVLGLSGFTLVRNSPFSWYIWKWSKFLLYKVFWSKLKITVHLHFMWFFSGNKNRVNGELSAVVHTVPVTDTQNTLMNEFCLNSLKWYMLLMLHWANNVISTIVVWKKTISPRLLKCSFHDLVYNLAPIITFYNVFTQICQSTYVLLDYIGTYSMYIRSKL